jgi:hypothetical protein
VLRPGGHVGFSDLVFSRPPTAAEDRALRALLYHSGRDLLTDWPGLFAAAGFQLRTVRDIQAQTLPAQRLAFPGEILAHHRDVVTAHRVKSHDQHDVVRHSRSPPARTQKNARTAPDAVAQEPFTRLGAVDPGTLSIVPRLRPGDWDRGTGAPRRHWN